MKMLNCLLIAIFSLSFSAIQAQDEAIWSTIKDGNTAWANRDADAFSQIFADDAVIVIPNGTIMKGKKVITENHRHYFKAIGPRPADATSSISDQELVHLNSSMAYATFIEAYKEGGQEGSLTYGVLFEKNGEKWLVKRLQITPVVDFQG